MQFSKALAPLAILALSMPSPVYAAKEAEVPRCNGQSKRPANPYGTVLPTLPSRKSEAGRYANPLGFQVKAYRADIEIGAK
ncbi:hypothetical protein [Novosphingobium sp. Chol11]|uniref:hypothetical protein n=1 Tax=Novosphingobium sp. Chol11 TaxID=1385763 RepID=UPI000BE3A10D|nr:hypothetical protein [Novosphingobium sp. Chol11]